MIDKWRNGADVVYGIRTKRKEPLLKRAGYKLFYRVFQRLGGYRRAARRRRFSADRPQGTRRHQPASRKEPLFSWSQGLERVSPGRHRVRTPIRAAGSTKYPLSKLIALARDEIFNFSTVPLTGVFYIGMTMSSISFLALLLVPLYYWC